MSRDAADPSLDSGIPAYRRRGHVVEPGLLSPAQVDAARAQLEQLVREAAEDRERFRFDPGDGSGRVAEAPRYQAREGRFHVQLEPESDRSPSVRKLMNFCERSPFFDQLSGPDGPVAPAAAALLGAPLRRFQDMALLKPPGGGEKPWHQDCAYFSLLPLDAVIGVWIALDEARVDNGCMHVLDGGHLDGPRRHRLARDCELAEAPDPTTVRAVEMAPGSALFFSGLLPHWTPPNRSDRPRRALQFHYARHDARTVTAEDYDRVFVDALRRPASCAAARATSEST